MFGERSSDAARASFSSRARLSGSALQAGGQELQRHRTAEPDVLGAIDLAHAAGAEALADAIVLNGRINVSTVCQERRADAKRRRDPDLTTRAPVWTFQVPCWAGVCGLPDAGNTGGTRRPERQG